LAFRGGPLLRDVAVFAVASAMFFFLSLDEFAAIHEYFGRLTRSEGLPVTGLWPFVFGGLGLAAAATLAVAGRSLWRADRMASVCLAGGLAAFTLSAAGLDLIVNVAPSESAVAQVFSFVEELGELLAATAMLYGAWRLAVLRISGPQA
ncbi:MAG TPA: hypothetical protein VHK06_03725, partial [Candidatus Limnocylindria bacterium]|nr:hypothetical protein [Candidatus Limnocylindria bacterium]